MTGPTKHINFFGLTTMNILIPSIRIPNPTRRCFFYVGVVHLLYVKLMHFKIDHIPGRIKSLPEFAPWGLGHLTMQTDLSPFHLQQYQVEVAEQKIGVEGVEVEDDLQPAL
jgi:hypothetical protein